VLEAYHLSVVHPDTFGRSGFTSSSRSEMTEDGLNSMLTIHPHDRFRNQLAVAFPSIVPSYRHAYIFPNLFVSVTNDLIYFVSNVLPITPDEAVLHYRLFVTPQCEKVKPAIRDYLMKEAIKFTETTLNEDKAILEQCQIGMQSAVGGYTLGARERRIKEFHNAYMHCL
jgi:phenylpropionate dioxygenase-like ring-hydroxylating dioxygenase large terminal subunit